MPRRSPLLIGVLALAVAATAFAQGIPATRPARGARRAARLRDAAAVAAASSQPAATQAGNFPTPAEIIAKMKAQKEATDALPKIAYISITQAVSERPVPVFFFAENDALTLRSLLERLKQATDDKDVKG